MPGPDTFSTFTLMVPGEAAGQRLDRYVTASLPDLSRTRVQALIRAGGVTVAGRPAIDPGLKLKADEIIALTVPPPEPAEPVGEAMPLAVIYEDEDLIVVDKPAGWVVHPAAGHASGTLVNALIAHCGESLSGIGGIKRPGIVHRLDKDTSGLLVVAKSDAAHRGLSEQFAAHGRDGRLHRAYLALAWGKPLRARAVIEANVGRSSANRTKMAVTGTGRGRPAVTRYEVLETFGGAERKAVVSLLKLLLETGRTHQIRVHLAHAGHPLLGDSVYGAGFKSRVNTLAPEAREAVETLGRQALHAAELGFVHPVSGSPMRFESATPDDLARVIEALRAADPSSRKR